MSTLSHYCKFVGKFYYGKSSLQSSLNLYLFLVELEYIVFVE